MDKLEAKPKDPSLSRWNPELENFVVDETNRLAHAAVKSAVEGNTNYNPIGLVGPCGVGKTELLFGGRRSARRNFPLDKSIYVRAETFCNGFVAASRDKDKSKMEAFRRHYRGAKFLFFDELPFINDGRPGTQEEFFWTLDAILGNGGIFIYASNDLPGRLKMEGRIISRLHGGLIARIDPLKEDTRRSMLWRFLERENLKWSADVQDLVVTSLDGDARSLLGVLGSISAHQRLLGDEVSIALVEEVLRSYRAEGLAPRLSLEAIEKAAREYFGILLSDHLRSSSRSTGEVAHARQLAMFLSKQLIPNLTLTEIGDYYGRDHTTVTYACRMVSRAVATKKGSAFRQYEDLRSQLLSVK